MNKPIIEIKRDLIEEAILWSKKQKFSIKSVYSDRSQQENIAIGYIGEKLVIEYIKSKGYYVSEREKEFSENYSIYGGDLGDLYFSRNEKRIDVKTSYTPNGNSLFVKEINLNNSDTYGYIAVTLHSSDGSYSLESIDYGVIEGYVTASTLKKKDVKNISQGISIMRKVENLSSFDEKILKRNFFSVGEIKTLKSICRLDVTNKEYLNVLKLKGFDYKKISESNLPKDLYFLDDKKEYYVKSRIFHSHDTNSIYSAYLKYSSIEVPLFLRSIKEASILAEKSKKWLIVEVPEKLSSKEISFIISETIYLPIIYKLSQEQLNKLTIILLEEKKWC